MKPWKMRVLATVIGGTLMLLGAAFSAYKHARIGGGWDSEDFWWAFRIGIAVTICGVPYLAFSRYD